MKTKVLRLPLIIIGSLLIVLALIFALMAHRSLSFSSGRYLLTDSGSDLLILGNSPVVMSNRTNNENMFSRLDTGDKILVLHDGIAESYPEKTGAYFVIKLGNGSRSDIKSSVLESLSELGYMQEKDIWHGISTYKGKWLSENYEVKVSYAGAGDLNALLDFGIANFDNYHSDKMISPNARENLPLIVLHSKSDLQRFKDAIKDSFALSYGYDEIMSFESACQDYDEEFFEENDLFVVYKYAHSGSLRFDVDSVYNDRKAFQINVCQTNSPELVTDDESGHFITVAAKKSDVDTCIAFYAVLCEN